MEDCCKALSYYDLICHIREFHSDGLAEIGSEPIQYTQSWIISYSPKSIRDPILYIRNVGIFCIRIDISRRGYVYGYVEIADTISIARYFYYELELGNDKNGFLVFEGQVVSDEDTHNKSNYLCIDDLLREEDGKIVFDCNLTITRLP